MRAGQLRHRITIQECTEPRDSAGSTTEHWSDVATLWGSIEPLKGREYFEAQQVNADVEIRIRTRYKAGIIPKMRVIHGSRHFNILVVIHPDERKRELELLVKEAV